jgi:protein involved in polysaccharide export with SLBB domain
MIGKVYQNKLLDRNSMRRSPCVVRCWKYALLTLALAGCASSPGGFTLFPTGHFLTDTTKRLREAAPDSPDVPRELSKSILPTYLIQPGDSLTIETESIDSPIRFPGEQTVLPDGTIDLGRLGRGIAAGKTVEQIEREVQGLARSGGDQSTVIKVRLTGPRGAVYYVLGEVNSPGAYPLTGRESVLDGLMTAGGISSRASQCNMILSRPTPPDGCRVVLPICYRHIAQMGDTSTNYQLMPGDRIYVASRTLCEQLAFWRNSRNCEFCSPCQCACPDGHSHAYEDELEVVPRPDDPTDPAVAKRPAPISVSQSTDRSETIPPTSAAAGSAKLRAASRPPIIHADRE